MASNSATLADEDGAYSDWIEIHNPDSSTVSLGGWYLTDTATNKTKWQFSRVDVAPGGFIIVWASNKNRRDPAKPLHTNFALSAGGEYLGLIKPDGLTVVSEFAPTYPPQRDDLSYGVSQARGSVGEVGYFSVPTPGRANGTIARNLLSETVAFSRASGPFKETFELQLSGASAGQRIRYVAVAPSSAGLNVPDPNVLSPEYVRPLPITGSTVIRAAVFSRDDEVHGMVSAAHFAQLESDAAGFTSVLPVLVFDNHGYGPLEKDGVDHPTWLYAYAPRPAGVGIFDTTPEVATPLTSTVRGQSAAAFPKKSFNLKFTDDRGAKRAQSLFGSEAFEKWALVSPWSYDCTFIYNPLAYALSNRIGRWAPRTQIAEVFYNTGAKLSARAYYGIGVLTDRIEVGPGRVEITPLVASDTGSGSVTGGYILKIDNRDDDEYGFITDHGIPTDDDTLVVVAYPKDADLAPAQRTYIRDYIQTMENTLFAEQAAGWVSRAYLDYIDRPSWVDHHILNTLAGNPDAFRRSAYFTKDRNGKLVAGPLWDFDRAFSSADLRNRGWDGWRADETGNGNVWSVGWWSALSRDPEFIQDWIDRWQSLRRTEFADASLTALIDSFARTIGRDAAARDATRWPDDASHFGDYDGEIDQLKMWLTRRADWIDRQFVAAPAVVQQGATLRITPPPAAVLAYTLDGSDPRSLGGGVAPNAILSTQPIEVSSSANLHARSYETTLTAEFPRTQWSSAISAGSPSPLTPLARLVNLSARSTIGAGDRALVANIVVSDCASKRILSRAVGPGLIAFGPSGTLPDPQLTVSGNSGAEISRNNGWDSNADSAQLLQIFQSVGAFPLARNSSDSAAVTTLSRGTYVLTVTSPSGREGLGLAEVYELDGNGRSLNVTIRGFVPANNGVLIAGFVVQGPACKRVLVRAGDPPPGATTTDNALGRFALSLYRGPVLVASNERWSNATNAAQIEGAVRSLGPTGAAGLTADEAAIFTTVTPGAYTAVIGGKEGAAGVATISIQEVP